MQAFCVFMHEKLWAEAEAAFTNNQAPSGDQGVTIWGPYETIWGPYETIWGPYQTN